MKECAILICNFPRIISQNFAVQDLLICPEMSAFYYHSFDSGCGSAFLRKLKVCLVKMSLFLAKSFGVLLSPAFLAVRFVPKTDLETGGVFFLADLIIILFFK